MEQEVPDIESDAELLDLPLEKRERIYKWRASNALDAINYQKRELTKAGELGKQLLDKNVALQERVESLETASFSVEPKMDVDDLLRVSENVRLREQIEKVMNKLKLTEQEVADQFCTIQSLRHDYACLLEANGVCQKEANRSLQRMDELEEREARTNLEISRLEQHLEFEKLQKAAPMYSQSEEYNNDDGVGGNEEDRISTVTEENRLLYARIVKLEEDVEKSRLAMKSSMIRFGSIDYNEPRDTEEIIFSERDTFFDVAMENIRSPSKRFSCFRSCFPKKIA